MSEGSPFGHRVPVEHGPPTPNDVGAYVVEWTQPDGTERAKRIGGALRVEEFVAQLDEQGINYEVTENN